MTSLVVPDVCGFEPHIPPPPLSIQKKKKKEERKKRLLVEIQKHDVKERLFGLSQKKEASKEEFRIERLVVSITCVGRRSRAHFG